MTHSPEQQRTSTEQYIHHIQSLAVNKVRRTPEYEEARGRGASIPEAFRTTAHNVAENEASELNEADRALLNVVADLGVFVEASQELEHITENARGGTLSHSERVLSRRLKNEYVIPFNHGLKEFINTHPNDGMREVSTALANIHELIFSRHAVLPANERPHITTISPQDKLLAIQSRLDGMRHEVASETILSAAGLEYDYDVSAEEDASGSDLFVQLGGQYGWFGFDIKASQASVDKARQRSPLSRAVATGLLPRDFTGQKGTAHDALAIPYATAAAVSEKFADNLYTTAAHYEQQRAQAARYTGRGSLYAARR